MSLSDTIIQLLQKADASPDAIEKQEIVVTIERLIKEDMTAQAQLCGRFKLTLQPADTLAGQDEAGLNPLMHLVRSNLTGADLINLLKLLIQGFGEHVQGTSLSMKDKNGMTVLHHIAVKGSLETTRFFSTIMIQEHLLTRDQIKGLTPGLLCLGNARSGVLGEFLNVSREFMADSNFSPVSLLLNRKFFEWDWLYDKILNDQIREEEILACLRLFTHDELLRQPGKDQLRPLCYAAANGFSNTIRFLLKQGDKLQVPEEKQNPIELALHENNVASRALSLDERVATVDALLSAEEKLDPAFMKEMLKKAIDKFDRSKTGLQVLLRMPKFRNAVEEAFSANFPLLPGNVREFMLEQKVISQECINKTFIEALDDLTLFDINQYLTTYLLKFKLPPDEKTREVAMKKILNWQLRREKVNFDSTIIPLLESGINPLLTGDDPALNIFEWDIAQSRRHIRFDWAADYSGLRNILRLPCIRNRKDVQEYCTQRLELANKEGDRELSSIFSGFLKNVVAEPQAAGLVL